MLAIAKTKHNVSNIFYLQMDVSKLRKLQPKLEQKFRKNLEENLRKTLRKILT